MAHRYDGPEPATTLASNRSFAICLVVVLALLLGYLVASPDTFRELRDGFLLGIIPLLAVAGMLVCAITMIFDGKSGEPFHASADEYRLTFRFVGLAAAGLASMYLFYRAVLIAGFPLSSVVYLAGLMFALGIRSLPVLAMASTAITGAIFGVFSLLGFALPVWPG